MRTTLLNWATNGTLWPWPSSLSRVWWDGLLSPSLADIVDEANTLYYLWSMLLLSTTSCPMCYVPCLQRRYDSRTGGQPKRMAIKKFANTVQSRFMMKLFASISWPDVFPLMDICLGNWRMCLQGRTRPRGDGDKVGFLGPSPFPRSFLWIYLICDEVITISERQFPLSLQDYGIMEAKSN